MVISIGEFIKFFRKQHNMTQKQLAEILECSIKGLSKIETGLSSPRTYTVKLFEDYFKVKLSRYYQNNAEMIPLASFEAVWGIVSAISCDELNKAYKLACRFEQCSLAKNNECLLYINYVKARFHATVVGDWDEAFRLSLIALQHEDYVYLDKKNDLLVIDSFMPSLFGLQLICFIAECFKQLGSFEKAIKTMEDVLFVLKKFIAFPIFAHFSYSKEDIFLPYSLFENYLAQLYYDQKRYAEALAAVEQSLGNHSSFGALHLNEKYYIKFKSLYSLKRYNDALSVLPDVLFYNRRVLNEREYESLQAELVSAFPEIAKKIKAFVNITETMFCLFYER